MLDAFVSLPFIPPPPLPPPRVVPPEEERLFIFDEEVIPDVKPPPVTPPQPHPPQTRVMPPAGDELRRQALSNVQNQRFQLEYRTANTLDTPHNSFEDKDDPYLPTCIAHLATQ
jgi:hypothetical protein